MNPSICFVALIGVIAASTDSPATILAPLVQKYQDLIYAEQYDELEDLYHPNAILVVKGQPNPFYTPEKIFKEIQEARAKVGNAKTDIIKETYTGAGDILMYENLWRINAGGHELSGPYRSIWVKFEGRWVIYHEQYSQSKRYHKNHTF
ncbi:unnamed protein product, partial [Mesorhabditis spiculigera]